MSTKQNNLLFIMTDHQRWDSIGMVQAGVEVTPNLNCLAKRSFVFSRAYAASPLCAPARTALATGVYPTRNGVVANDWKGVSAGDWKPIHQVLFDHGYDVAHIGIEHIQVRPSLRERLPGGTWIDDQDYEEFLHERGIDPSLGPPGHGQYTFGKPAHGEYRKLIKLEIKGQSVERTYTGVGTGIWPHPSGYFLDSFYSQEAVKYIAGKKSSSKPFALFVYLKAPHPPLCVPEPFASKFAPQLLQLPENVGVVPSLEPSQRRRGIAAKMGAGVTMEQWRRVWAAHLGLVSLADACIGRILDSLSANGKIASTNVVFTVDHGTHLGQRSMYQMHEMYDTALRVPLLFSGPDIQAGVSSAPVSHLDVMPTLVEALSLTFNTALDGHSLWPTLYRGVPVPKHPVFSQYSDDPPNGDCRRSVVDGRFKYIYDPCDAAELYDLQADPLEMNNLVGKDGYRETEARLHELCKTWAKSHGDWVIF